MAQNINTGSINARSISQQKQDALKLLQSRSNSAIDTTDIPITETQFNQGVDQGNIGINEGMTFEDNPEVQASRKRIDSIAETDEAIIEASDQANNPTFDPMLKAIQDAGGILKEDDQGGQYFDRSRKAAGQALADAIEKDETLYDLTTPTLMETDTADVLIDRIRKQKQATSVTSTYDEASSFIEQGERLGAAFDTTVVPFLLRNLLKQKQY